MKVTFDSNVLVYSINTDAGEKHRVARELLLRARRGDCLLTLQSLGELYWVAVRKAHAPRAKVELAIRGLRGAFPVHIANEGAFDDALKACRDHAIPFWDSLLWATAQKAGCDMLFSEDGQDQRRFGSVLIVNPFKPENRILVDAALPPAD